MQPKPHTGLAGTPTPGMGIQRSPTVNSSPTSNLKEYGKIRKAAASNHGHTGLAQHGGKTVPGGVRGWVSMAVSS